MKFYLTKSTTAHIKKPIKMMFVFAFVVLSIFNLSALVYDIPRLPESIDVSDIDLDGRVDVAIGHTASEGYPAITLLRNYENERFASIDTSFVYNGLNETIHFAKMNQDDYPDLVVMAGAYIAPTGYNDLRIYYNNAGHYQNPTDYIITTDCSFFHFVCADVNGDGLDDPICASNQYELWTSMINLGNNQFTTPIIMDLNFPPQAINSGDLNGDGIADVLISGEPLEIFTYLNETWQHIVFNSTNMTSDARICDIDNDGDNDIVTYQIPLMGDDCILRVFENQNGQFMLRYQHVYSFPSGLEVFDYNNDNLPDFLLANKLVTNLGNFAFSDYLTLQNTNCGDKNVFVDIDHNGYLDILAFASDYTNNRGFFFINFNDGHGNFVQNPPTPNNDLINEASPLIQMSCYPNPFSTNVNITYSLPKSYRGGTITIFNIRGERVKSIPINSLTSISKWDGKDETNKTVASGIYFYRLVTNEGISVTLKMLYLK